MSCILVVDDVAIVREPIAAILRLAGHETVCAADGAAALAAMAAMAARAPDLILLDLVMPGMDGLMFLRRLRDDRRAKAVPVMLLTAVVEKQVVLRALRLGARECLLKSRFSANDLLTRVARLLAAPDAPAPTTAPAPATSAATGVAPPARPIPPATRPVAAGPVPRLLDRDACLRRAEQALQAKTLSGVVMQVVSLAASPRGDAAQLSDLIARDVVLSSRVLQLGNSATYASGRGCITSIPDAVRRVGSATVRNVAAALGIFDAMPVTAADGFNPIRCWQHSFAVARLCEHLARADGDGADAGLAYLAGLCHDLGEILFHTHFAAECRQIQAAHDQTGRPLGELEREMMGMRRGELAATILRCLGLPGQILAPIEALHRALDVRAEPRDRLTCILRAAEYYANGLLLAGGGDDLVAPLTRAQAAAACAGNDPAPPDGVTLRGEVLGITGMLARLGPDESDELFRPAYPKRPVRLCFARDPGLSAFDPLRAALEMLADVDVADHLPGAGGGVRYDGLVIAARTPTTAGFTRAAVLAAAPAAACGGPTVPILWLAANGEPTRPVNANPPAADVPAAPAGWPVTLDELAGFVGECERRRGSGPATGDDRRGGGGPGGSVGVPAAA